MEVNLLTSIPRDVKLVDMEPKDDAFTVSFPAMRGIQAGREYYVAMCPLKHIPQLIRLGDTSLPAELRAQRVINKARVPVLTRYVIENPDSYVFSSLTASIDGEVKFRPAGDDKIGRRLGTLRVALNARVLINDGQHRRAAIEQVLKEKPLLGEESLSVVFFVDAGLARSQQMFADLNRHAIRPTKSLGILYDHRDPMSRLVSRLVSKVTVFCGMTETSKTSISNRSIELFTLSSIYQGTRRLLSKREGDDVTPEEESLAHEFWSAVAAQIPDWHAAKERRISSHELRQTYIHAHGVAVQAIAIAGGALIASEPKRWRKRLEELGRVDWKRNNAKLWEGRALIGGRLSKAQNNVILTANVLKGVLGIPLEPNEQKVEELYDRRR
jgi:DNA sulfur modification protein DndB